MKPIPLIYFDIDPNGRPLIRIEAHDSDSGENGKIRYSIASGDTDNLFYLDPITGSLLLKSPSSLPDLSSVSMNAKNLDQELSYLLQLEACDMGKPKRCAAQVWLQMVMDYPSSMLGRKGFQTDQKLIDTSLYTNFVKYPEVGNAHAGYQMGEDGNWPTYKDRWPPHNAHMKQAGLSKEWQNRNEMRDVGRDGRYPVDFNGHERGQYGARRSGVTASEAVIICLAVIFAILLFAALVLIYLVKRKSIYFSIGGKHKAKRKYAIEVYCCVVVAPKASVSIGNSNPSCKYKSDVQDRFF